MYVLDTNILVAAFRSRNGASFLLLEALVRNEFKAAATASLLLEYRDVLGRDKQLDRFWTSEEEVDAVLAVIAARMKPVTVRYRWRPQLPDPDDEMVLECAINARAKAIVTFNTADFTAASRFGIGVMRPGRLVRELGLAKRRNK
mgnify:CR=1 FL=1|jgi:putative PIN family toxin of toxin-antitoxin system|tara:strand:- start:759 stop:1193 length:435 start_codon:yes stop_codon:yes gene_type:complete